MKPYVCHGHAWLVVLLVSSPPPVARPDIALHSQPQPGSDLSELFHDLPQTAVPLPDSGRGTNTSLNPLVSLGGGTGSAPPDGPVLDLHAPGGDGLFGGPLEAPDVKVYDNNAK